MGVKMSFDRLNTIFPCPLGIVVTKLLDLRGKQCPMTFVYTKVALEKMDNGDILEVILDFRSAFTNVPASVKKQDLGEIVAEKEENGVKAIWIRRLTKK
jgi:TusA-related sulfurtransferase